MGEFDFLGAVVNEENRVDFVPHMRNESIDEQRM